VVLTYLEWLIAVSNSPLDVKIMGFLVAESKALVVWLKSLRFLPE